MDDLPDRPSKSQRKRDATALQRLGERLVALRPDLLARLPLDDELREAIRLAQRITARGGLRRQLQLVGRLMRAADAEAIAGGLEALTATRREDADRLHLLEGWRERLLREGPAALDALLARHPTADRATLEGLVVNARQGTTGSRALFRYLRDTILVPRGGEPGAPSAPSSGGLSGPGD